MNIRFRHLATIGTSHPYYTDRCRDFGFYIPGPTLDTLRGARMLARELDANLHLLYEADDSDAPFADISGQTLYVGLRLRNPCFGNFSAEVLADPSLTPLYANLASPTAFDPVRGVRLVAGLYLHKPQADARPVTLTLSDAHGHAVLTEVLAAAGEAAFDLRALPPGAWTIGEDYGAAHPATSSELLLLPDARDAGVWGLLAITVDAAFFAAPPTLAIPFTPRQDTLKYYIVASNFSAAEFDQLLVVDGGFIEQARPEIKFDKVAPGAFTADELAPSLLGDSGQRIVLFKSQASVARRERGLRKLRLQRNGEVVIEHLPQPGIDRPDANLIINLAKP